MFLTAQWVRLRSQMTNIRPSAEEPKWGMDFMQTADDGACTRCVLHQPL